MKKLIFLMVVIGVITQWDVVSGYLDLNKFENEYSVGTYNSEKWYYDYRGYEEALKVSAENRVPIFIYVYTDWCKYCSKFKNELLTENNVTISLSHFVKVRINPELKGSDPFSSWN